MTQRAPAWMWIVLALVTGALTVTGIVLLVPKHGGEDAEAAPMEVTPGESGGERRFILLGFDTPIPTGVDMNQLEAGTHVRPWGPSGTLVCFGEGGDEDCGSVSSDFGIHGGQVWFRGPAGKEAGLTIVPG